MLYSRAQLKLLLALGATLLAGLGVREWRAGFPERAERMERFDRDDSAASPVPPARPELRPLAAAGSVRAVGEPGAAGAGPESPSAVASGDPRPLDINRASVDQIARLPGVGPSLAERILAERERRGRFESPDALRYVLGMGPKKLAAIRALIMVSD